jgi:ABC-type multidrug transport system fused ATPase/permease subunit
MTNNRKYPITPSDWIIYLQGEITSDVTIMLSIVAAIFLIVLSIMQMSIITGDTSFIGRNGEIPSMIELAFEFGAILIFVLIYIMILIKPKSKLCKRIIKGEIANSQDILKEYNKTIDSKFSFWKKTRSKKSKKFMKNNHSKNAKQELGNWKNNPAFIKYNK